MTFRDWEKLIDFYLWNWGKTGKRWGTVIELKPGSKEHLIQREILLLRFAKNKTLNFIANRVGRSTAYVALRVWLFASVRSDKKYLPYLKGEDVLKHIESKM